MIYVVVSDSDDLIVNRINWNGDDPWDPPSGCRAVYAVDNPEWGIGGTLTAGLEYTPPTPPES